MVRPSTVTPEAGTVIQVRRTFPPSITAGPTMVIARSTVTASWNVQLPSRSVPPVAVASIAACRLAGQAGGGVAVGAGVRGAVGTGVGGAVGAAVGSAVGTAVVSMVGVGRGAAVGSSDGPR